MGREPHFGERGRDDLIREVAANEEELRAAYERLAEQLASMSPAAAGDALHRILQTRSRASQELLLRALLRAVRVRWGDSPGPPSSEGERRADGQWRAILDRVEEHRGEAGSRAT